MRRNGFTLLEALIASAILYAGMNVLWDGYLTHHKLQAKLDREVDALTDLASVSELLSRDAEACTARPSAGEKAVNLPNREGVIRWRATEKGLEREDSNHAVRRFPSLACSELAIEVVGPRMVVLARVRGPGDDADTVLARAVPIGSQR